MNRSGWWPVEEVLQQVRREAFDRGDHYFLHVVKIAEGEERGGGEYPLRTVCIREVRNAAKDVLARRKAQRGAA
jgi:hypothetical protein